jgi:plastocyanin
MALVLLASACGGDNKSSSSSGTTSASGSSSASGSGSASSTATTAAATSAAATTAAAGTAPVSLPGKVNEHGSATVKDGASVEIELDDFYFGPTYLTGPAGAKLTVELSNEGQKNHTFTIDSAKIDQEIDPGKKATVQVTLPASGSLAFYCKFHVSGGMQGAFAVG